STLSVQVTDAYGEVLPGITVQFVAPTGSGDSRTASAIFSNSSNQIAVLSDASGIAATNNYQANSTAGMYQVSAMVAGISGASFALTNLAGAANHLDITGSSLPLAGAPTTYT